MLDQSEAERILNHPIIAQRYFFSQKFPINKIGKEKKRDKKRGIKNKLKGIKNLKDSSNVNE